LISKMHKRRLSKQEIEDAKFFSEPDPSGKKCRKESRYCCPDCDGSLLSHLVLVFIIPTTSIKQGKLIDGIVLLQL